MLNINDFKNMILSGADEVISKENELTQIDSKFGDADHGITMKKVMESIKNSLSSLDDSKDIKSMLDDTSFAVMMINGGSAVPLWSTLFEGMSASAPSKKDVSSDELKVIFRGGYDTLFELSKAKTGDKTLMDALLPAVEGIENSNDDIKEIMDNGAICANKGAMDTKDYIAKFGRAKSYKEQTIGTPDAGAMGMKYFFEGMSKYFS